MNTLEIVDDNRIIQFRGRGLVSSDPDATNIVTIDNVTQLQQTGEIVVLEIPDNRLSVEFKESDLELTTIGIQGTFGGSEDDVLNDDNIIDFTDDDHWYEGWAAAGSLESDPVWKIRFTSVINAEGDTEKKWADGTSSKIKVWDDRLTYSY